MGIVHIGLGAFHRAHQAVYTDDALAAQGGDWRILGISLRGTDVADALNPQNGLYTVLVRGPSGTSARLIGSISGVVAAVREPAKALAALADPVTRLVSITVTERAYGIERASGSVDPSHPAIAHDLAELRSPVGTVGMIVEALRRRRLAGTAPFAVLCCDNLPNNGKLIRVGVLDFAGRINRDLRDWIAREVAFPSTMVDRITPATTDRTLDDAERLIGARDLAAVETEPFAQWVIEDNFPLGRPPWEAGGAIFVHDVEPYEQMKLRMLNGTHSLIAYSGFLAGCRYVRDAMAYDPLARLVARHLDSAARTLTQLDAIDLVEYARHLEERFRNPAIFHETYQIAMDGTEKLPQRLFEPAVLALEQEREIGSFAFTVAAWMRYCIGRREDGTAYELREPRQDEIRAALDQTASEPAAVAHALHALPGFFPERLRDDPAWRLAVEHRLSRMVRHGMRAAIEDEAGQLA